MAPKKDDSSSSSLRRFFASFSSMRPAERSASIAICLPGIASRVKRAATSAMRPEPFVITTKFTMMRIAKTITPMTKFPPITNWPNASMTWPAAAVPSWPYPRMRRVDARLSASLSIVEIRRIVGKTVNSSGFSMNSAVIRISTETMIDTARNRSSRSAGIGKMSTTRMVITATARRRSERFAKAPIWPMLGRLRLTFGPAAAGAGSDIITSLMSLHRDPGVGKFCRAYG